MKINMNNEITIEKLRKAGYRCRINCFRYSSLYPKRLIPISAFRQFKVQELLEPKGGLIKVVVTDLKGNNFVGEAHCSPSY